MSTTYYTSLSGMIAASYGLQNTSNNIANMQSPGFKRSDVFYSSLGNSDYRDNLGSGVTVSGHGINFKAGNYSDTGNPSDLAIVGQGFFIVKLKNGELLYTRDGEFDFNKEGLLYDKHSHGLVQGYNNQGSLISISKYGSKINPGVPTHSIDLSGQLVFKELDKPIEDPSGSKEKFGHIKFDVGGVFDKAGKEHKISFELKAKDSTFDPTPNANNALIWELDSASCNDATITFDSQSLEFNGETNGAAIGGGNTLRFKLNDTQLVTLNFGDFMTPDSAAVRLYKKDVLNPEKETKIDVKNHDGYGNGKQVDFSFDDNGQISYEYDNGQTEQGTYVGLARFEDLGHTLVQAHDNLFRAKNHHRCQIGRANKEGFGAIQPQKLESANVDSTTEFANIVVLQRMFQACSQIMDIDKQLLEELYQK